MSMPHEQVAEELRAVLARRRLPHRRVARALGWTHTYLSRRLNGEIPLNVNDLYALAALLELPVTEFLDTDVPKVPMPMGGGRNMTTCSTPPPPPPAP